MPRSVKLPQPITILALIIVGAAVLTWFVPAGKYDTLSYVADQNTFLIDGSSGTRTLPATTESLESLHILIRLESFKSGAITKPVSIPGTYHRMEAERQGLADVLFAPVKGITGSIEVILFVLVIGGFIRVFNETGAIQRSLNVLSLRMRGRESWLIVILTFLFTFGGSSFGMAEEGLAFYPILIPLFLAAGYDLLVPVAVIYGGTQLGTLSSFSNPFSTIIASNAAGVSWDDGLLPRVILFLLSAAAMIWYIARYAERVKKNPERSLVYRIDGIGINRGGTSEMATVPGEGRNTNLLVSMFLLTFAVMIYGVVFLHWYLTEMTVVFLVSAIVAACFLRIGDRVFLKQFIGGAGDLLGVAFIIGVARGISVVLDEGNISQSIVFYAANMVSGMPPPVFILLLMLLFMVFTLFISSTSGMAVATMPIMGSLAVIVGVPGREIVNAYLFGMGIMGFVTPTGLILPSLAVAGISFKTWLRFCWPLLLILVLLCGAFLVLGIGNG